MISQFVQKHFMMRHMDKLQTAIDKEIQLQQSGDRDALERRDKTGVTVQDLQNAKQKLANAQTACRDHPDDDPFFIPQEPVTSITQAVLQKYVVNNKDELIAHNAAVSSSQVPTTPNVLRHEGDDVIDLFSHFGPHDVGWSTCLLAEALRKLDGRHKFNEGPGVINPISNHARIVLLSDWGTGVPRAQDVARSARRFIEQAVTERRDVHVIHLGDVYYAGFKHEYDERFFRYWPVDKDEADTIASYCLNGNHDMYSGAHGYFEYLLSDKRFRRQQQCSFFGLENSYWQILGLDTAYDEGALHPPQPQWVLEKRSAAPHKPGILLSHHQPFSAFREFNPNLIKELQPAISRNLILAWWWGHEHRCVLYEPQSGIPFGRCIGYGGVPVLADSRPLPPGVAYLYRDFVAGTNPPFARFGFAVMDFNEHRLRVQYLSENGKPHHQEEIIASSEANKPAGQI